uniref:Uncharacterized protein n=1 Tax=Panagrolaimus sp. ES5 TaxID=591445 RepID=A0AC34F1Z0_9BILA
MYQQRPQGMQPQRPGQIPPTLQQQQQMQQQRMGRPGMPQGNYPNQQQQSQMGMHQGGQPQQQQAQQSRGQPSQQQQQQAAAPPQVSPKIPQEKKYKDATFQSKEKMPEPFIWVNMPSQNMKNDRNRPRDNKKKGKNSDDYYRDRESRGRY